MFNFGLFELTLFGVIALIVLGPEKLPEFARTIGKWYGLFRRTSARLQNDLMTELELSEAQALLKQEIEKIRASEAAMKAQMDEMQNTLAKTQRDVSKNKRVILDAWDDDKGDTAMPATQNDVPDNTQRNAQNAIENNTTNAQASFATNTANTAQHGTDNVALTKPMNYHWFLLGEYDRKRRLPKAPLLPNYTADRLL